MTKVTGAVEAMVEKSIPSVTFIENIDTANSYVHRPPMSAGINDVKLFLPAQMRRRTSSVPLADTY